MFFVSAKAIRGSGLRGAFVGSRWRQRRMSRLSNITVAGAAHKEFAHV